MTYSKSRVSSLLLSAIVGTASALFAQAPSPDEMTEQTRRRNWETWSIFDVYANRVSEFLDKYGGTKYVRGNYSTDIVDTENMFSDIIGEVKIGIATNPVPLSVDVILRFSFFDNVQDYELKDEGIVDRAVHSAVLMLGNALGGLISSIDTGEIPFMVFFEIDVHGATTREAEINDWRRHEPSIEFRKRLVERWEPIGKRVRMRSNLRPEGSRLVPDEGSEVEDE